MAVEEGGVLVAVMGEGQFVGAVGPDHVAPHPDAVVILAVGIGKATVGKHPHFGRCRNVGEPLGTIGGGIAVHRVDLKGQPVEAVVPVQVGGILGGVQPLQLRAGEDGVPLKLGSIGVPVGTGDDVVAHAGAGIPAGRVPESAGEEASPAVVNVVQRPGGQDAQVVGAGYFM